MLPQRQRRGVDGRLGAEAQDDGARRAESGVRLLWRWRSAGVSKRADGFEFMPHVAQTTVVRDAWERGQTLAVHGWIYGLKDGLVRDQGISISDEAALQRLRSDFLYNNQQASAADPA